MAAVMKHIALLLPETTASPPPRQALHTPSAAPSASMASVDGSWYSPLRSRGREDAPSPLPRLGGSAWRAACLLRAGVGPHARSAPSPSARLFLFLLSLLHLRLLRLLEPRLLHAHAELARNTRPARASGTHRATRRDQ
ncbi:hypothetical protein C8T65DRAFT_267458 [Cerioporus squamosus]|nr:hypothetical protein C8T65DRAFT_267458 [Cerioporus squamosus]